MIRWIPILSLLLLLLVAPLQAQETAEVEETLTSGNRITGRIDDSTPRVIYTVDGSRGEVLRFRLETLSGDLDPVLTVFNNRGEVIFQRDDSNGSRDVETTLTIQENALYFVVVARFGYGLGSTSGDYELLLERVGVLSEQGTTLRYGIPVINTISNTVPQVYYTFRAEEGDILNIEMVRSSGTLDPYLQVVDANRFLIAENDDIDETTRNARIENLLIERTGTYIVVATRWAQEAGNSAGNFVLLVDQSRNSGLGNNRLAPAPIFLDQSVEGAISDDRTQQYYEFEAEENQLVTITMERIGNQGQLDAYLVLANAGLQPLIENDDGGSGKNARIETYRLPAAGRYVIIATRFGRSSGETSGNYRLTLIDEGNAFEDVPEGLPRLLYGAALQDRIIAEDTESVFAFWGTRGERVTIAMNRNQGNLDPVLELLDDDQVRMIYDDNGGNGENARIATTLTYTGVYFIRATRYQGSAKDSETTGEFTLLLSREDS